MCSIMGEPLILGRSLCTKTGRDHVDRPAVAVRSGRPRHHCPPGSPGSGSPTAEAHLGISQHM